MARVAPWVAAVACVLSVGTATADAAPQLDWKRCGKHVACATAEVPRDYGNPARGRIELALAKVPAKRPERRIGSLFFNFGGPGASAADVIAEFGREVWGRLNRRYDLIGFDPRGVGKSRPAIDCRIDVEAVSEPFPSPSTRRSKIVKGSRRLVHRCLESDPKRRIFPYVSTANVARDLNRLRAAVGDRRLHYLGYSYGTAIGGTFQSLFPHRVGRMVLDGPVNLNHGSNHPLPDWVVQAQSFGQSLNRFLRACKADQRACSHFGSGHPERALRELVAQLDQDPIPAKGSRRRPVDGDDLRAALATDLYSVQWWGELASGLADAEAGDGTMLRYLADYWFGRLPDGSYDPYTSANLIITTVDQAYPRQLGPYLATVRRTYRKTKYLWWTGGSTSGLYSNYPNGLFGFRTEGVFRGPFENSSSRTTLVVGTTHDAYTPYVDARAEARQLGNARLLTMKGDSHTAYPDNSPCIDRAVYAYLAHGKLPRRGTACEQRVPFEALQQDQAKAPLSMGPSTGAPFPRFAWLAAP